MKKSNLLAAAVFAVALVLLLILSGAFYTVDQTEQVIITQFGQPVGDPITAPGLHFRPLATLCAEFFCRLWKEPLLLPFGLLGRNTSLLPSPGSLRT